jgi:hypothetical protein
LSLQFIQSAATYYRWKLGFNVLFNPVSQCDNNPNCRGMLLGLPRHQHVHLRGDILDLVRNIGDDAAKQNLSTSEYADKHEVFSRAALRHAPWCYRHGDFCPLVAAIFDVSGNAHQLQTYRKRVGVLISIYGHSNCKIKSGFIMVSPTITAMGGSSVLTLLPGHSMRRLVYRR